MRKSVTAEVLGCENAPSGEVMLPGEGDSHKEQTATSCRDDWPLPVEMTGFVPISLQNKPDITKFRSHKTVRIYSIQKFIYMQYMYICMCMHVYICATCMWMDMIVCVRTHMKVRD